MQSQASRATGDDGDLTIEGEDGLEVVELDLIGGRHVAVVIIVMMLLEVTRKSRSDGRFE